MVAITYSSFAQNLFLFLFFHFAHTAPLRRHLATHCNLSKLDFRKKGREREKTSLAIKIPPTRNRLARLFISISTLRWLQTRHHQHVCKCSHTKHDCAKYILKGNLTSWGMKYANFLSFSLALKIEIIIFWKH